MMLGTTNIKLLRKMRSLVLVDILLFFHVRLMVTKKKLSNLDIEGLYY